MLARTENLAAAADTWLAQFERALSERDDAALRALFHDDSYWRDVLAFTWDIRTIGGADAIGRVRDGQLERLPKPGKSVEPIGIDVAPDGSAWYTDIAAQVVSRMTAGGPGCPPASSMASNRSSFSISA